MHAMTLKVDDSVYDTLLGLLNLLPKDKVSLLDDERIYEPNETTKQSIQRLESNDDSLERYGNKDELFKALGL